MATTPPPQGAGRLAQPQIANLNTPELGPKAAELKISDDELRDTIESNQLRLMKSAAPT
jgi:4-oxalmesaconate hydratase